MAIYDVNGTMVCPPDELAGLEDLVEGRLLVWHDEFKTKDIDPKKWGHLYGRGTTSNYMSYAENIEKVAESGNGLSYRCIKDYPYPSDGINYSSAYLMTLGKFEFRYGRIEAKMRFPSASPHHSTFWTLGSCSQRKSISESTPWEDTKGVLFPSCGEIDIAELDNGTVGARTHWSLGGFDTAGGVATGGNIASLIGSPTSWHIYACEWTDSSITFFVDGVQKGTWSTSNATVNGWNPFKIPHFIILNCIVSLSGQQSWDIAQTDVAWVRVYAPADVTEVVPETAISIDSAASISVGQRKWLAPTFTPANPTDMTLNWLSHNENIVTCYGGMLVGVSTGTTYVQCTTAHGYTALCKVTVS